MAIELYKKGIDELEKGIALDCNGGRGEVWDRAQRIRDKMKENLKMARERLDFLGKFDYSYSICIVLQDYTPEICTI